MLSLRFHPSPSVWTCSSPPRRRRFSLCASQPSGRKPWANSEAWLRRIRRNAVFPTNRHTRVFACLYPTVQRLFCITRFVPGPLLRLNSSLLTNVSTQPYSILVMSERAMVLPNVCEWTLREPPPPLAFTWPSRRLTSSAAVEVLPEGRRITEGQIAWLEV